MRNLFPPFSLRRNSQAVGLPTDWSTFFAGLALRLVRGSRRATAQAKRYQVRSSGTLADNRLGSASPAGTGRTSLALVRGLATSVAAGWRPASALALGLAWGLAAPARAQSVNLPGPTGSGQFGTVVALLPNGNYIVTDPGFDQGSVSNVGAVYLYRGTDNGLISTLTGSTANDQVGSNGVTVLPNGNFVVRSQVWQNGGVLSAGAVTWGNASTGVSGVVSAANSLIGATANDQIGANAITVLSNGNYVVRSATWDNGSVVDAGAVTWANGSTGTSGVVSAANSLVGATTNDQVGSNDIVVLSNGNYVVRTPLWNNSSVADAGAVTWANGSTGTSGVVSAANSLVGSTAIDNVGTSVTALSNGNYVVCSVNWDNGSIANAGAATWANGSTGLVGVVSTANSLVGSTTNDNVGGNVTALTNGNYVVRSTSWDNGSVTNVGAVTWANGSTGLVGVVSPANSLVGSTASDGVGGFVTALTNGNYVVSSINWDNGSVTNAGAVTWANGSTGISGVVSPANSLVGSTASDGVGGNGAIALPNGNYVVRSTSWDNGSVTNVGAATWGNGSTGISGVVSPANSLVGSTASDGVGTTVTVLSNGNYVVSGTGWDNGSATNAGAATWANGSTGISGVVSPANSLVGSTASDGVGGFVAALTNGNYVVRSTTWNNCSIAAVGAATWANGSTGLVGVVSPANSLIGSTASDNVGTNVIALTNGHYVVVSQNWDNGSVANAGAVTWANGSTGLVGVVSTANSLVGSKAGDSVGSNGITATNDGNYLVGSFNWDNGSIVNAGAQTLGQGTDGGTVGPITTCNSVVSALANQFFYPAYRAATGTLLVGLSSENRVQLGVGAPPAPTGAASQSFTAGATITSLAATGTAIQWYSAPTGGSPLATTTALVDGTTYYASQSVGGCVSATRLAVTATLAPPAPTLTSLNPTSGPVGTSVTLTGTNFLAGSTVRFNGTAATAFTVVSNASITATVPAGTTTGNVTVTTTGGTSNGLLFTVTAATPDLTISTGTPAAPVAIAAGNYNNVTITGTGNALLSGAVTVSGTLLVQGGGSLSTNCQPLTGSGSFELQAGATLLICDPAGIAATGSTGAVQLTGTRSFSPEADYVYTGTGAQATGPGLPATVRRLISRNPTSLSLAQPLTIGTALTLSGGTLAAGTGRLVLGSTASISETETSYVLGTVATTRPLVPGSNEAFGGLGLSLSPAAGSVAPGTTLVTRTTGTALAGAGTSQSILRAFDIQPTTNAGLNVSMTFAYFDHELNGIAPANLRLFKSETGTAPWVPQRGATLAPNLVSKAGITDFSVWTLGNAANPLPVELTDFTATATGPATVRLAWATASEKNSQAFEVERSLDGTRFERLGTVAAAGNSSSARSYGFTDNQVPKTPSPQAPIYYRLRQVDADGTFAYSPVRSLRLAPAPGTLSLFPNPASGTATLQGVAPGTPVTVLDALGRELLAATADASGQARLVLPAGTPAGVYVVRADGRAQRLVVR